MTNPVDQIETALIPAGAFTMGDDNGRPDERPAHRVTLSAFRMAVLPVTNEEYAAFLTATGQEPPRFWDDSAFNRPRQPVVGVSWYDAVTYCDWLSGVQRRSFRMPTEAEWEKAARGGVDGAKYPWGDESFDGSFGRFQQTATWQVGTAPPNGYGLIDIGFNVHEWCSDWYDPGYYVVSPEHDPRGPSTGERRASRGGAWRHAIKVSRCSARSSIPPDYRYNDYGFRVVLTANPVFNQSPSPLGGSESKGSFYRAQGGCHVTVCAAELFEAGFHVARTHEDGTNVTTRVGCHGPPKAIPDRKGPVECT